MQNIINIEQVSKNYSGHQALDNVSFDIPKQAILGLLGPNGAGKTSLLRMLTRITLPDSGQIHLNGRPLQPDDVRQMGYLPEERGLYKKMPAGEQVIYLARLKGMSRSEATQAAKYWFDLLDLGNWFVKPLEELSKGMQQKIQFVVTVIHSPQVVILDEPFTGFDPINAQVIKEELLKMQHAGTTLILSTHRMESVEELCSHIALIDKGRLILAGSVPDIKKKYRSNLYRVAGTGKIPSIVETAQLLRIDYQSETYFEAVFDLKETQPGIFLKQLLNQVSVSHFSEQVPGMEALFLSLVKR